MSWTLSVVAAVAALAGCAAPPAPAWRIEVSRAVEQAVASTLAGRTRAAQQQWRTAQEAAASAGRADMLARVALARCAVEQAALARDAACAAAQPYLTDAGPAERAYAAYLALAQAGEGALLSVRPRVDDLPSPHQAIALALQAGATADELVRLLAAMDDPLARLVAGGLLWHAQRLDAAGVSLMVETASQQGWRRPLAAWLGVQVRLAEAAGDAEGAARAQRRLDWVLGADATGAR